MALWLVMPCNLVKKDLNFRGSPRLIILPCRMTVDCSEEWEFSHHCVISQKSLIKKSIVL